MKYKLDFWSEQNNHNYNNHPQGIAEECKAGGPLHHHEDVVPGGPGGKGERPPGQSVSLCLMMSYNTW